MKQLVDLTKESLVGNIGIGLKDCEVIALQDYDGYASLYTFHVKAIDGLDALCKISYFEKGQYVISIDDDYDYTHENNSSKRKQMLKKLVYQIQDSGETTIFFIKVGNQIAYQDRDDYIEEGNKYDNLFK